MNMLPNFNYIKIPKDDIIEFSFEQDCGGMPLADIQFVCDKNNLIYNKKEGDNMFMEKVENNKQDSIDKILEIYRKDVIKMIDATADENIAEIRKKSKLGQIFEKVLKYSEKQIKDAFPDNYEIAKNLIYISFDNDGKMQRQIDEEISKRNESIEKLDEVLKEVRALLDITETYEQKMDILKRYEILDKDGLLV